MRTMRILSMAALALVGTVMISCSSDDSFDNQQPANNVVIVKTTVNFDDVATTRALTINEGDKEVKKTFAVGDKMDVSYVVTSPYSVVVQSAALGPTDISADGKTATFTVTLTDVPADGDYPVEYNYPSVPNGYNVISGQDGTLATLQSTFDRASGSGTMNVSGGIVTLPNITMSNKMAILAIKLLNSTGTNTITQNISKLEIDEYPKQKEGNITVNHYSVKASSGNFGDDVIYVAVWPTRTDAQYWVTAYTKNGNTYTQSYQTKKLYSRNYTAGNFYNIGWKLTAMK